MKEELCKKKKKKKKKTLSNAESSKSCFWSRQCKTTLYQVKANKHERRDKLQRNKIIERVRVV